MCEVGNHWRKRNGLATFGVILPGGPNRIVHILNRHFVPADLYAQSVGRLVEVIDDEYAQLLSDMDVAG